MQCEIKTKLVIQFSEPVVISPGRWLASCLIPLVVAVHGYRKKSITLNGALLGCAIAFILTLSNYSFLACLITFFISSSKATKIRPHIKRKFEEDFKEGKWEKETIKISINLLTT